MTDDTLFKLCHRGEAHMPHQDTSAGFGLTHLYSYGNLQKSLTCAHWGVMTEWASARLCTLPPAHIQCHHSSNQPPRGPDWIINHPINASLHSVRLSASKYLPMQNNPRRLDYHFKLSLFAAHNQVRAVGEREGPMGRVGGGRKFSSFV